MSMVPRRYVRVLLRAAGLLVGTVCLLLVIDRFGSKFHPGISSRTGVLAARQPARGWKKSRSSIFAPGEDSDFNKNPEEVGHNQPVQAARRKVLNGQSRNGEDSASRGGRKKRKSKKQKQAGAITAGGVAKSTGDFQPIDVVVNNDQHIAGFQKAEDNDVYLPFKFVRKYFDVYGDVKTTGGSKRLAFSHSYGKPFSPGKGYKHKASGPFLNFGSFNVAGRERVLYLDECNMPVSAQWDPKGFHFATQISQYGLQHYSAMVDTKRNKTQFEWILNPGQFMPDTWNINERAGNRLKVIKDTQLGRDVVQFSTEVPATHLTATEGIFYRLPSSPPKHHVLLSTLKATGDGMAISVRVLLNDKRMYTLHYDTTASKTLEVQAESVTYRLVAEKGQWFTFARNVQIDIQRAIVFQGRGKDSTKLAREAASSNVKVVQVMAVLLRGHGIISNMSLRTDAHYEMVMDVAKWLVKNQNATSGGWPTHVTRTLKPALVLKPGWYSAMVQGQCMSLLVRAFYASKNKAFLNSALKATDLFHRLAKDGGVRAVFLKEYVWYEEYPTQPSSFVLNGFIFSLLGLYDLAEAARDANVKSDAGQLYADGLRSLKALAMLYDTGVGTIYDLRHFSIPTFPPNRARWDYHVTHINLMTAMSSIDKDPVFPTLRERWLGYMVGRSTKHN